MEIMKCKRCNKGFKPNEKYHIHIKENYDRGIIVINSAKSGFYCLPCWKATQKEQWTAFLIGVIIAFFVIAFWAYVIPKLFGTKKKRRRR